MDQGCGPDAQNPRACLLSHCNRKVGWGTWIRTKNARVRVGSFTIKLFPIGVPPRTPLGVAVSYHEVRRHATVRAGAACILAAFISVPV